MRIYLRFALLASASLPCQNFDDMCLLQRGTAMQGSRLSEEETYGHNFSISVHAKFPARWTQRFSTRQLEDSQAQADKYANRVVDAMSFCWTGYKSNGFGADDVKPLSGKVSNWANMGVTALESLDTLHLMGLHKEFNEAALFVRETLNVAGGGNVQTMEITIRALGGLLSAYSLTGMPEFLQKAHQLGASILKSAYAFDASAADKPQSLLPSPEVSLASTRSSISSGSIYTAEAGTLQLEFKELSAFTGDPVFERVTSKTVDAILDSMEREGRKLYTDTVNSDNRGINFVGSRISLGARSDSFLEYLVKAAIQDPTKARLRKSFRNIMDGVFEKLVFKTQKNTTFIAELDDDTPRYQMDHLVCFLPGTLMLASHHFPKIEVDSRWKTLAVALTETCHKMYMVTASNLAPEFMQFDMNAHGDQADMVVPEAAPFNLLRPEAAESLFYMHYYTGDPMYRAWAGDILSAFEKHSKGKFGFTAVDDVRQSRPTQRDAQESFFLAETLKYLYLTFARPEVLDLNEYVLNTEAHPLLIATSNVHRGEVSENGSQTSHN